MMDFFDDDRNLFRILSVLELSWDGAVRHANPRPFHALSFRLKGDASFVHDGVISHVSGDSIAYVPKDFEYTLDHQSEHLYVVHFEIEGGWDHYDFFSLSPDDTNYLFFVTDLKGNYYYATTYNAHLKNVQTAEAVNNEVKASSGQ